MQLNVYNREPMAIALAKQDFKRGLERRMFYLIINQLKTGLDVKQDLFKNTEIQIQTKYLDQTNYKMIKEAARNLKKREIHFIDDKNHTFKFITPFPEVSYAKGVITVVLYENAIPYFLELSKGYSEYQISIMQSFKSEYTQRMYEILSGKKRMNDGVWKMVSIDYLKKILDAETYVQVGNFIQRVIDVASTEMEEKGDIYFEYEKHRTGRKITHLTFKIFWAETPYEKFQEELNDDILNFNGLTSTEKAYAMKAMLENYKFSDAQKREITTNIDLFTKFFEVNKKIEDGLLGDIKDITRYMAATLGFTKK